MFNTALIFIKPDSAHAFQTVQKIVKGLKNTEIQPKIATTNEHVSFFQNNFSEIETILFEDIVPSKSLAFSIGGDGTFLFTIQQLAESAIPIIGIHEGNRGFLTPFMPTDIPTLLKDILNKNINIQEIPVWEANVSNQSKPILFINEIVLQRHAHSKMVKYTLGVEGMGSFKGRADGVIISSSIGSTAYNLTAGGSIVHPSIESLSITPICPHNLKHKTVIIPSSNITLTLNNDNAGVSSDGFSAGTLDKSDTIKISPTEYKIKYVSPKNLDYINHISEKIF